MTREHRTYRNETEKLRAAIGELDRLISALEQRDDVENRDVALLLDDLLNAQLAVAQAQILTLIQRVPNSSEETERALAKLLRLVDRAVES